MAGDRKVVPTTSIPTSILRDFFVKNWGSTEMVISSGVYPCDRLAGFAVLNKHEQIAGLITYQIKDRKCEIISLDSLVENEGIGSRLVTEVEQAAKSQNCTLIKVITTNDNLRALMFYQKRGYRIVDITVGAVEKARLFKPEIPKVADNGIAICDELLLQKYL